MRIAVYPHDLDMGGSQINAIELSSEIQRLGHEVLMYGQPGRLLDRISAEGLEFVSSPRLHRRPTPTVVAHLRRLVRGRDIDVVHGYEWPPSLEADLATRATRAVGVSTILSMSVAPFLRKPMPMLVGTEQIRSVEREFGRAHVGLMEPPVDTRLNSPEVDLPLGEFRDTWGVDGESLTVVVVSRLSYEMKSEGILAAIDAVRRLHPHRRVQLLIVGGGPAEDLIRERANTVNAEVGRKAVVMTGELMDPRPAYAVADVVLGMGSSALRAMAFGKPLIVQGIDGFWEPLTSSTLSTFLWQGWYGQGSGTRGSSSRLASHLDQLMGGQHILDRMSRLSLRTVQERFSLRKAALAQLDFYEHAQWRLQHRELAGDGMGAWARFTRHQAGTVMDRLRGREAAEDFNNSATLLAQKGSASPPVVDHRVPRPVRGLPGEARS